MLGFNTGNSRAVNANKIDLQGATRKGLTWKDFSQARTCPMCFDCVCGVFFTATSIMFL